MPDLAIVGAGIMGANHVRTARALREWERVIVVDPDLDRATKVASANGFRACSNLDSVLGVVDAVIVAAPSSVHEDLAAKCIQAGKHLLIEKPLADEIVAARRIAELAVESEGKVLVGHVERFNSAVSEIVQWAGQAIHLEFRRVGPKGNRVLGDVVSDLMVHDLEIFLALANAHSEAAGSGSRPEIVEVSSMWADAGDDLCTAMIRTSSGLSASFIASRIGQVKNRSIILTGRDVQVVADLVRQGVSVYRITHTEFVDAGGARYRQTGTTEIPFLDSGEPLFREQRHFVEVVQGMADPVVGVGDALAAMELVEGIRTAASSPLTQCSDQ